MRRAAPGGRRRRLPAPRQRTVPPGRSGCWGPGPRPRHRPRPRRRACPGRPPGRPDRGRRRGPRGSGADRAGRGLSQETGLRRQRGHGEPLAGQDRRSTLHPRRWSRRRPGTRGQGCWTSSAAVSVSSVALRQPITPDWAKSASTPTEVLPARPPTTASSGLRSANRRAVRANFMALPNDSRWSAAALTWSSSIHAASRSLLETSSLAPSETNECTPTPRSRARSSSVNPTPPDWEATARPPGSGRARANVVLSRTPAPTTARPASRSDHADAVRPGQLQQLARPGTGPDGESRGDHDRRPDAGGARVGHDLGDPVGGNHDDDEVDGLPDRGERPVGGQAGDGVGLRVHDVQPAGVPGGRIPARTA